MRRERKERTKQAALVLKNKQMRPKDTHSLQEESEHCFSESVEICTRQEGNKIE